MSTSLSSSISSVDHFKLNNKINPTKKYMQNSLSCVFVRQLSWQCNKILLRSFQFLFASVCVWNATNNSYSHTRQTTEQCEANTIEWNETDILFLIQTCKMIYLSLYVNSCRKSHKYTCVMDFLTILEYSTWTRFSTCRKHTIDYSFLRKLHARRKIA